VGIILQATSPVTISADTTCSLLPGTTSIVPVMTSFMRSPRSSDASRRIGTQFRGGARSMDGTADTRGRPRQVRVLLRAWSDKASPWVDLQHICNTTNLSNRHCLDEKGFLNRRSHVRVMPGSPIKPNKHWIFAYLTRLGPTRKRPGETPGKHRETFRSWGLAGEKRAEHAMILAGAQVCGGDRLALHNECAAQYLRLAVVVDVFIGLALENVPADRNPNSQPSKDRYGSVATS
jgi:hypothetical protein